MSENGMRPLDALLAATRNIAAAYHKLDQLGTLEKGKVADLVVLNADPLQNINNVRKISMVIKEGQVVDREKLPLKKSAERVARRATPELTGLRTSAEGGV